MQILDIFEYSTSSCPSNKQLLIGDTVLRGGDTLGQILFDAAGRLFLHFTSKEVDIAHVFPGTLSDAGLTERALELSFRLSDHISRYSTTNSNIKTPKANQDKREAKLQEEKRKKTKSEWEKKLFPTKLYPRALEKKRISDMWKELNMRNFEEVTFWFTGIEAVLMVLMSDIGS